LVYGDNQRRSIEIFGWLVVMLEIGVRQEAALQQNVRFEPHMSMPTESEVWPNKHDSLLVLLQARISGLA